MNAYQPIELAGATLWLLAEKAIYWPAQQALLVADIHFGKAAAYRRLGQPVPHGTTDANLRQLDGLLARYCCRQLIFLGDFLHAPESHAPATLARLAEWRSRHPQLAITLVRGNHDRRAGDPPAQLGIDVVNEPLLLGPYALQHEPQPHPSHHVLAGHVHPAFPLQGRGRQRLRLPCFCIGERLSLLPAFGSFTGTMTVATEDSWRIYVVGMERCGRWRTRRRSGLGYTGDGDAVAFGKACGGSVLEIGVVLVLAFLIRIELFRFARHQFDRIVDVGLVFRVDLQHRSVAVFVVRNDPGRHGMPLALKKPV